MSGIRTINFGDISIAVVDEETVIKDTRELLDLMATVSYTCESENTGIIIYKQSLPEEFFELKTGVAGEMLQKFSNYRVKLAIIGDFEELSSKSLRDFIRECNRGNLVYFTNSTEEAIVKLKGRRT